jgi:hypothetical protein
MSHPTAFLVDLYLEERDTEIGIALRHVGDQPKPGPYLAFVVASLIWAGRAVDFLDRTKSRRSELRSAARRLGITSELHPSPRALGFGSR